MPLTGAFIAALILSTPLLLVYFTSIFLGRVPCNTLALLRLASLLHPLAPALLTPTDVLRLFHGLLLHTDEVSGLSLGSSIRFHLLLCRLWVAYRCITLAPPAAPTLSHGLLLFTEEVFDLSLGSSVFFFICFGAGCARRTAALLCGARAWRVLHFLALANLVTYHHLHCFSTCSILGE